MIFLFLNLKIPVKEKLIQKNMLKVYILQNIKYLKLIKNFILEKIIIIILNMMKMNYIIIYILKKLYHQIKLKKIKDIQKEINIKKKKTKNQKMKKIIIIILKMKNYMKKN